VSLISARVKITGERPLLWHHFGPEALPLNKTERNGVAGNDPSEWRRTVLMTPDRQLYLEPAYIFGCVRDGAKHTRHKRGTLQPFVSATLQVLDSRILIDRKIPEEIKDLQQREDLPVYLDIRSVRNPATRGRNVRYRIAASPGWSATFTIAWDNTVVSRDQMEAVLNDAGKFVGLGDGRSIGFGRFAVQEFAIEDHATSRSSTIKPKGQEPKARAKAATAR
jgi:hypothetical protein